MSRKEKRNLVGLIVALVLVFISMVFLIPLLPVTEAAVEAGSGWYLFVTFFDNLQTWAVDRFYLIVLFIIVVIALIVLKNKLQKAIR